MESESNLSFLRRGNHVLNSLVLAGLINMFACAIQRVDNKDKQSIEQVEASRQKILALERKCLEFSAQISARLDEFVTDPARREKIKHVFALILQNSKNATRFKPGNEVQFGQENGFAIAFRPYANTRTRNPAVFNGLTRTIFLPDDFDPEDLGDLIYFFHEVAHVPHDDDMRKNVTWARYVRFWKSKEFQCVVDHELDATSTDIEILNVALFGEVEKAVRARRDFSVPAKRGDEHISIVISGQSYFNGTLRAFIEGACTQKSAQFFDGNLEEIFDKK